MTTAITTPTDAAAEAAGRSPTPTSDDEHDEDREHERTVRRLFAAICSYTENLGSSAGQDAAGRGSELDLAAPRSPRLGLEVLARA